MSNKRLKDRIAFITGASSGIGRAVALAFARQGAHVIVLARTAKRLEAIDDELNEMGAKATLVPLDLSYGDRIDNLGPTIYERWGKLDILIANAGLLGPLSPLCHIASEDWEEVLDVNLTANWRLIRTMDPLLRQSDAGRAVFVTSGAARNIRAYWGPYAVSKAGLEALVLTYAAETETTPLRVNLLNPGATATAMRAQAMPGEDPGTLPSPEEIAPVFVDLAAPDCQDHGQIISARDRISRKK